ncbi:MAG: hypothetical protein K0R59_66 [Sphingobacterium sp.]|jgi:hypothetical protein|nr:hypothetical protein [Sphingobacterium sp.]
MVEKREVCVFFSLLRAGLWNIPFDRMDCLPLSETEWEAVYQCSLRHTVEGILFDGIQQLDHLSRPSKPLLLKWMVRVEKIRQRNNWMNEAIREQQLFFNQNGLNPILLKGQGAAHCYVNPDRRISGDIDWYFETSADYNKASILLENIGLHLELTTAYSTIYNWKGCQVDQHARLFDIHNPFLKNYLSKLECAQEGSKITISSGDSDVSLLSPLIQIVQTNAHILKHLLSFGVGIRQLCDAARLYYHYKNQFDPLMLKKIYQKLSINRWIDLLHQLLVNFLGLPQDRLPFPLKGVDEAEWMMEDILKAGNFGFYDNDHVKSQKGQLFERKSASKKIWNNFWKYLPYAPMEAISFPVAHFFTKKLIS